MRVYSCIDSADKIDKTKVVSTVNSQAISQENALTIGKTGINTIKWTIPLKDKIGEGDTRLIVVTGITTMMIEIETMNDTEIIGIGTIDMTDTKTIEVENTLIGGLPDLPLPDILMIVTDGMTLVRVLRTTGNTRKIAGGGIATMTIGGTSISTAENTGEVVLTGLVLQGDEMIVADLMT